MALPAIGNATRSPQDRWQDAASPAELGRAATLQRLCGMYATKCFARLQALHHRQTRDACQAQRGAVAEDDLPVLIQHEQQCCRSVQRLSEQPGLEHARLRRYLRRRPLPPWCEAPI